MAGKYLVLGHARHGKDTFAECLARAHKLSHMSSSLFLCQRVIWPHYQSRPDAFWGRYENPLECFADRRNNRDLWFDLISEYTRGDPARLAREILARYDIYVGMRDKDQFAASKDLFDRVYWVDASRRVPPESTRSMNILPPEGAVWVDNNGTFEDLQSQAVKTPTG